MRKIDALARFAFVVIFALLAAGVSHADDQAEIIAGLDEIDRAISESQTASDRSAETLDVLRKELYRSAVQTRDAKRLAKEIETALAKGDDATAELLGLKKDIVNAGIVLRDVNNALKRLATVTSAISEKNAGIEAELDALKLALVDPSEARKAAGKRLVKSLEKDLAKANDLAEQRGEIIDRLNKRINTLKESRGVDTDMLIPQVAVNPDIKKANQLLDQGNIDEALLIFNNVIYENPDSNDARLGLAACYFERGEMGLSRRMIEEVQTRDKSNPKALGLMGALHYNEGNLKKARRSLEKALRIDEFDAKNLNYMGAVQFEQGRQQDGIEYVQKAVEIDPSYVAGHYNLAVMLAAADQQDLTASKIHYRKALSLGSPRDPIMDNLFGLGAEEEVGQ